MTNREIDFLVAEQVMGFTLVEADVWGHRTKVIVGDTTHYMHVTDGYTGMVQPYSSNIGAAYEMEEKIKERKLITAYLEELYSITIYENGSDHQFYLIHATPKQRCHAALKAVALSQT